MKTLSVLLLSVALLFSTSNMVSAAEQKKAPGTVESDARYMYGDEVIWEFEAAKFAKGTKFKGSYVTCKGKKVVRKLDYYKDQKPTLIGLWAKTDTVGEETLIVITILHEDFKPRRFKFPKSNIDYGTCKD